MLQAKATVPDDDPGAGARAQMSRARLRVLIVEDSVDDVSLILRELRQSGYTVEYKVADSAAILRAALDALDWDIVIVDYSLPGFSGMDALKIVRDPKVYLVGRQVTDDQALSAFLADEGVSWQTDTEVGAERCSAARAASTPT